ncbi:MAG: hypothetical protein WDN28_06445 [Chthoniobacter sp.]
MPSLPRWSRFGLLLLATTSLAAPPAVAPLTHCEILGRMSPELLHYHGALTDAPDPADAAYELGAAMKLAVAAAHGDEAMADYCWQAVDAAFAKQTKAGGFGGSPDGEAVWLGELCRSLLVIRQSPLADHFKARIEALQPALGKAMRWLTKQRDRLFFEDRAAPDRLFAEAEAFLFSGRLLGDDALLKIGHGFLDSGLKTYRPADGAFLENNGTDSGFQAASLVRLQEILLNFPEVRLEEPVAKGVQWELGHIDADGAVRSDVKPNFLTRSKMIMGKEKPVNVGEISLALLYYHERTGNPAALAAVERLQRHYAPAAETAISRPSK